MLADDSSLSMLRMSSVITCERHFPTTASVLRTTVSSPSITCIPLLEEEEVAEVTPSTALVTATNVSLIRHEMVFRMASMPNTGAMTTDEMREVAEVIIMTRLAWKRASIIEESKYSYLISSTCASMPPNTAVRTETPCTIWSLAWHTTEVYASSGHVMDSLLLRISDNSTIPTMVWLIASHMPMATMLRFSSWSAAMAPMLHSGRRMFTVVPTQC